MKKLRWILFLSVLASLYSACETVVDVPLPEHESKLVINARLETFFNRMFLSRSRARTDIITEAESMVEGASCFLFENDQLIDSFKYTVQIDTNYNRDSSEFRIYDSRYYELATPPWQAGNTYQIEVFHPDFPTARAETYMPHVPEILGIDIEQNVAQGNEGLPLARVKLRFQDPPNEENYFNYLIQIKYSHPDSLQDTLDFVFAQFNTDGSLRAELEEFVDLSDILGQGSSFWGYFPYTSDEGKDGQIIEVEDLFYQPAPGYDGGFYNPQNNQPGAPVPKYIIHSALVSIYCPSKDLFLYMSQYDLHRQNQGVNLSSLIGEPVILHSNVENGYGIFGISNFAFYSFTF
ncbi:MAG: DUF4249 family protein [Bacteroidota bacterium]